jgi:cytochrome P450
MDSFQVRDEAISMLIVGHSTTSALLTWALYELSQHPDVEAEVLVELDAVLAGRAPTIQDMRQLKVLDKVIKETLRLYPPSWAMPRDVVADIELGDYRIPKGTGILFSQHVMHRDPRWFPEPQRFLPERFVDGWEANVPKCAYMPFGHGSHICIGQVFATTEAQLILAMLLQRFRLTLVPGQQVVASPLITQRPRDGLRMRIEQRHPVVASAPATIH